MDFLFEFELTIQSSAANLLLHANNLKKPAVSIAAAIGKYSGQTIQFDDAGRTDSSSKYVCLQLLKRWPLQVVTALAVVDEQFYGREIDSISRQPFGIIRGWESAILDR